MSTQQSREILHTPTTQPRFGVAQLSGLVRGIVAAIMSPRETILNHRRPQDASVYQLRRDVKYGKTKPVDTLLRISFTDLDDGLPLSMVTQGYRDMIQACEEYAARKAKREGSGVLPFLERFQRAAVRETTAQAVADVAAITVDPNNLDSLIKARAALQRYDEPQQAEEAVLTAQIVKLQMCEG